MIVLIPDHCLSIYYVLSLRLKNLQDTNNLFFSIVAHRLPRDNKRDRQQQTLLKSIIS